MPSYKKVLVTLSDEGRISFQQLVRPGKGRTRKITRAQILLKEDQNNGGPAWTEPQIGHTLDVGVATVERVRKRFVDEGSDAALHWRNNQIPWFSWKLNEYQEAQIITLACNKPPEG